jgi:hypothetical protein
VLWFVRCVWAIFCDVMKRIKFQDKLWISYHWIFLRGGDTSCGS